MAQDYTTSTFSGTVLDVDGQPIPNARVTIESTGQGFRRSTIADTSGDFRLPALPVGAYSAVVEAEGYSTETITDLVIRVGSGAAYDVVLNREGAPEQDRIIVTARRFGIDDFAATTSGLNLDVAEISSRLPVLRDQTSLLLLAPATVAGDQSFGTNSNDFGNLASISGSSVGENVYYINGMNVTNFRTFLGGQDIPFEFYEQLEVKTGGYQADFGRSTGGAVNAVTRSGTNEFEFGVNAYWTPDELASDPDDTYVAANSFDRDDVLEGSIYAGGPIIKDRLFAFGIIAPRYERQEDCLMQLEQCETFIDNDPFTALKIDALISPNHRLEFTHFDDKTQTKTELRDFNPDTGDIGAAFDTEFSINGGNTNILRYTGAFADWLTVSALYGRSKFYEEVGSAASSLPLLADSTAFGNPFVPYQGSQSLVTRNTDERELFRIDFDVYFDLAGSHHVRFGIDREELSTEELTTNSGNAEYNRYFTDFSGNFTGAEDQTFVRIRNNRNTGVFDAIQTAIYVQDAWKISDRWAIQAGVRNETFENKNANGDTFVELTDQVAPRLGVTFDPVGDGRNKLTGFYGRYYLPVATNTNIRASGAELFTQEFYPVDLSACQTGEADLDGDGDLDPVFDLPNCPANLNDARALITGDLIRRDVFGDGVAPNPQSVAAQNLDPLYTDEFILGYERLFDNGWRAGVRFTYRELGNLIEDTAVDQAVLQYCADNGIAGCEEVWTGFHSYVLVNPGEEVVWRTDELPGTNGELTEITLSKEALNLAEPEREYMAVELTFERPFDGRWGLQGSYVYTNLEGNYEGVVKSDNGQTDAGLTVDFDVPGFLDGANGPLPNEREHVLKLFGSYGLSENIILGANVIVSSPRQFGCIGHHPTDLFALQYGNDSWYCLPRQPGEGEAWQDISVLTPRGSQLESDWTTDVDLSAVWAPEGPDGALTFRVDVFNVFDAQGVTDRREIGEGAEGNISPFYGLPLAYQAPRRVRFGATWRY